MAEQKDQVVDHLDHAEAGDTTGSTVMAASQAAVAYEAHQHSLTFKESIRENWKPLAWCK